jgi:hypothetical protein
MDWHVVLPRLHDALAPNGLLVIIGNGALPTPWETELFPILARYSMNQEFQPGFDLVTALQERRLFDLHERRRTTPVPFSQPIGAYVESFHARNGLSRDRMDPVAAAEFDDAVRSTVGRYGETVELQLVADVAWGRPQGNRQ